MQDAEEIYEKEITERLENRFPVNEKNLKDIHKNSKKISLKSFLNEAIGDEIEEYLEKLKKKIEEKYEAIFFNNQNACKVLCSRFLQENHAIILQKMKKGGIKTFSDFEKELKILKEYAKSHCPVMNLELLGEFLLDSLSTSGDYFIKNSLNELSLQKELFKESISRLESEIKENQTSFQKEKEELRLKLSSSENEKIELGLKEKNTQEKLDEIKSEKENFEKESRLTIRKLKTEFNEKLEDSVKKN